MTATYTIDSLSGMSSTQIPITLTIDQNFAGDSLTNRSEITAMADIAGDDMITDIDSTPDADNTNDP